MPAFLRRPLFWLVVLGVLVLGVGGFVFTRQAAAAKAKQVAAAKAQAPDSPYAAIADGKADVEGGVIQVAARTAGIIRSVDVQEGAAVRRGDVLAQLEDDQPRLNVANAQAAVQQAQAQIALLQVQRATAVRELGRLGVLQAKNYVSGQTVDKARDQILTADAQIAAQRAAVATASAALNSARYQLELTRVRAPADGRIVRRYANPGAGASTLNVSTLFDLVPATPRIVRAEIVESAIPLIAFGQAVEIAPEASPDHVYVGHVVRRSEEFGARKLISDDPSEKTDERVVEVVVSAENAPLLIGQRVLVKFMKPGRIAGAPHTAPAPIKTARAG